MTGVNKVILIGNLGRDPEVRTIENGAKVANFSLATTESYRNKDGNRVEQTEWHRIVLWRGLAEVAEKYVKKGSQLYIEGRIKTRSYTDQDGKTKYITEIVGDVMQMLGKRSDESQQSSDMPGYSSVKTDNRQEIPNVTGNDDSTDLTQTADTDDLPF